MKPFLKVVISLLPVLWWQMRRWDFRQAEFETTSQMVAVVRIFPPPSLKSIISRDGITWGSPAAPLSNLPQRRHAVFLRRDWRQLADYYAQTILHKAGSILIWAMGLQTTTTRAQMGILVLSRAVQHQEAFACRLAELSH